MSRPSPPHSYPPPYPVYPARPPRRVARASGSVVLPILGVALVVLGFTIVPWSEGIRLPTIVQHHETGGPVDFGTFFAFAFAYPSLVLGTVLAFAANLDSPILRWLHFALSALLGCGLGSLTYIGWTLMGVDGTTFNGTTATAIGCATVTFLALTFGLAFIKGVALRVTGGLILLGYALITALGIADLYNNHSLGELYPWAFLPALGWLFCAIGAISGPRYEWVR